MTTRVLYVHGTLGHGGAEHLRRVLVTGLVGRGVDCRVCVLGEADALSDQMAAAGAAVDVLPCSVKARAVATTQRLTAYLRRHRPHIVQGCQFDSNFHACVAGFAAQVGVRITEAHGFATWMRRSHRLLDVVASRFATVRLTVSHAVRDARADALRLGAEQFQVIHNPYCHDAHASLRGGQRGLCIGTVGTLRQAKGHDVLLRAFAALPRELDARLVVVGDGPLASMLRDVAVDLGIAERVRWLGARDDIESILPQFDVFAFPSREEGLGIALLEAMAAGLPVVAARSGGIPEIVRDGETGLLVPPDDARALTAALRRMTAHPPLRHELGIRAEAYARRHHNPDRYVDAMLALYEEALTRAHKRAGA